MLHLSDISCVIPDERPSLFDLKQRYAIDPAELMVFHRIYGLDRVPVCREPLLDLLSATAAQVMDQAAVRPEHVRCMVHTHTSQPHVVTGEPLLARTSRRLGLAQARLWGMTTNNCASTIVALQVIDRVLSCAGDDACAILIVGDIAFTPILQIVPHSSVTGDAAVACLLRRRGRGHRVLATRTDVYGQHARCQWQRPDEEAEFEAEYPERLARTMSLALEQAGIGWKDVRQVIPHNINTYSWKKVARSAGIPMQLIYLDQVPRIAHCFGADILLNLHLAEQDRSFRPGDYLLLATVGLGAVFAAAVIQYAG
jgi:3-oxoacyl-[acyl-carrier-protein] synthase-3